MKKLYLAVLAAWAGVSSSGQTAEAHSSPMALSAQSQPTRTAPPTSRAAVAAATTYTEPPASVSGNVMNDQKVAGVVITVTGSSQGRNRKYNIGKKKN